MDYIFIGDKLNSDNRIAVGKLEEILTEQPDGFYYAAWEIIALRLRLKEAGIQVPGGCKFD